jgi:hypothetical protein
MKILSKLAPLTFFAPLLAFAQVGNFRGFETFVGNVTGFINNVVVPFIFALAFLAFIWGMFKTFILGGSDEEKQEEGKKLMMYSVVGFVLMVSIWGIVNFVSGSFGFQGQNIQAIPNVPSRATD